MRNRRWRRAFYYWSFFSLSALDFLVFAVVARCCCCCCCRALLEPNGANRSAFKRFPGLLFILKRDDVYYRSSRGETFFLRVNESFLWPFCLVLWSKNQKIKQLSVQSDGREPSSAALLFCSTFGSVPRARLLPFSISPPLKNLFLVILSRASIACRWRWCRIPIAFRPCCCCYSTSFPRSNLLQSLVVSSFSSCCRRLNIFESWMTLLRLYFPLLILSRFFDWICL